MTIEKIVLLEQEDFLNNVILTNRSSYQQLNTWFIVQELFMK